MADINPSALCKPDAVSETYRLKGLGHITAISCIQNLIRIDPKIKSIVPLPKLYLPDKFQKNLTTSFFILLTDKQKNNAEVFKLHIIKQQKCANWIHELI